MAGRATSSLGVSGWFCIALLSALVLVQRANAKRSLSNLGKMCMENPKCQIITLICIQKLQIGQACRAYNRAQ